MTWQMRVGALLGAASVGTGAYGAHLFPQAVAAQEASAKKKTDGQPQSVPPSTTIVKDTIPTLQWRKNVWSTAVQYQQLGAVTLMASAAHPSPRARMVGGVGILVGTALFSGANYAVAKSGSRDVGGMAPVGGMSLIAGFVAFVLL